MRLIVLLFFSLSASASNAQQTYLIDWDAVGEESIQHLVDLIQIDSRNPPGNETKVVSYLEGALEEAGIASKTYALDESRANLVARVI